MECQHPTCRRTLVIDCLKPEFFTTYPQWESMDRGECQQLIRDYLVFYCLEHCTSYGYCWSCGLYLPSTGREAPEKHGLCHSCRVKSLINL